MRYSEGLDMPGVSDLASAWCHKGTRTNQGSSIFYIKKKAVRQHAQNTTFGLFVEASLFRLTSWFHIHFFFHLRYGAEGFVIFVSSEVNTVHQQVKTRETVSLRKHLRSMFSLNDHKSLAALSLCAVSEGRHWQQLLKYIPPSPWSSLAVAQNTLTAAPCDWNRKQRVSPY